MADEKNVTENIPDNIDELDSSLSEETSEAAIVDESPNGGEVVD